MAARFDDKVQRAYHRDADPEHYYWQTRAPYFAETEARLLDGLELPSDGRLLEIGCGEGGNLFHLRGRGRLRVGIDSSSKKASFAARNADARALVADAGRLPFADDTFDAILIRDLLHHVQDRVAVLGEARRVLKPGGRLMLIEPNARSLLIALQAALVPAERGVLDSIDTRLRQELTRAGLRVESHEVRQPLPLGRLLLHPKLPLRVPIHRMLARIDAAAARLMPQRAWMYLVYQSVKP